MIFRKGNGYKHNTKEYFVSFAGGANGSDRISVGGGLSCAAEL
jgi:hypothetical protein